jgi:hypothetical protein
MVFSCPSLLRRLLLGCCCAGAIFGCGPSQGPAPSAPVLPDEKLVEVLKDVQLAEAALQQCAPARRDSAFGAYYAVIFRLHGIGRDDFEQSMSALLADPERTARVYARVSERLIEEEAHKPE